MTNVVYFSRRDKKWSPFRWRWTFWKWTCVDEMESTAKLPENIYQGA